MRAENVVLRLKRRQEAMERNIFSTPPADWSEFVKRMGTWRGIQDALSEIHEEAKQELIDE